MKKLFTTGFGAQCNTSMKKGVPTQLLCCEFYANKGDIVEAMASQEVTNEDDLPAFESIEFFVSLDPNATRAAANVCELTALMGENVDPDRHHAPIMRMGAINTPYSGRQYAILAGTWDPDDTIEHDGIIELGNYGKLDVTVEPSA